LSHSEHEAPIIRTSPRRMVKMLIIIIGIQIVGGALFFSHYDFWNSYLPIAGRPVSHPTTGINTPTPTGKTVNVSLKFL
jgi:nitrite reductase (NO-forming)